MENESFLMSCIAAAIINVENDLIRENSIGSMFIDDMRQDNIANDMILTFTSALEGLLHMLEGDSAFLDIKASLQLERFNSFFSESKDSKLIFKFLDYAYKILTTYMNENIPDSQIKFVQIGLIHLGRLIQIRERDVLGRLGAQLESEMDITTKQGQYYVQTLMVNCSAFIEEAEHYVTSFFESVANELFELQSEIEADMLFQPWALYIIIEWTSFRPLRTVFVDCVIRILAYKINIDITFSESSILVIDTASVVANRLRFELFPTCPVVNTQNAPTKGRGHSKNKISAVTGQMTGSNENTKEDIEDPISNLLKETLQRRPEAQSLPNLSISKTHQRKTAFAVMNRATKNKYREMFCQWKAVLEQATLGRSIEEPLYCESIFQLAVILEQIIQKSNS